MIERSMSNRRLNLTLIAIFSANALVLSAIGLYGVMAYAVAQRRREIGVRIALGAQKWDLLRLILGNGIGLIIFAIAIGAVGAFILTRFMSSMLFGVGVTDPTTYVEVAMILTIVGLLACYIPARRAGNMDPLQALHYE